MQVNVVRISWRMRYILFLGLLTLAFVLPQLVSAHGGGTPRLIDVEAGPYRLFAWTQPEPIRADEVHVSIGVVLNDASATESTGDLLTKPVTDATITVHFTALDGESDPLIVDAILGGVGTVYYEADTILPTAGSWRFTIEVSGSAGEGRAEFVEEVLPARTVNMTLLASGGVLFVLLIVLVGLWNRRQDQPTAPQESLVNGR